MAKDLSISNGKKKESTYLDTEEEDVKVNIMDMVGMEAQPRFTRKSKDRSVSSSIPLMKVSQVTGDEVTLDRIHWKLVKDKGSFYVFERRTDYEIEEMRERGEFE